MLVKLHDQFDQGGFTRAALTDKGDFLALSKSQINIMKYKGTCTISEADTIKSNITF
ncbi:hypothetical protein D3C75_1053960 [compost metagenome]